MVDRSNINMAPAGRTRLDGHASTLINPLLPPNHPPTADEMELSFYATDVVT